MEASFVLTRVHLTTAFQAKAAPSPLRLSGFVLFLFQGFPLPQQCLSHGFFAPGLCGSNSHTGRQAEATAALQPAALPAVTLTNQQYLSTFSFESPAGDSGKGGQT